MKTVLFLNHNQENLGTYYRCLALAKGLSGRGFRVKMICASGKNFDLRIRKKMINPKFTIFTLPRIKYHQYFTGQLLRLFLTIPFVLFSNYDICHAFTVAQPQIAIPAWLAKVIRRKPLFIDWDDIWGGGFAEEHTRIVSKVLRWHERYFLQFADKITYVSEFIRDEIEVAAERYPCIRTITKIKVPNGANVEQIPVLDRDKCRSHLNITHKIVLLSVGNTYTDSLKVMLEAFDIVWRQESDAHLYLVGDATIPRKYIQLYARNKTNIVVTGKITFDLISYYLGAADVLLLPMADNAIENARFPMRLGDYLSAGRPIVSNAVGEVKYYLDNYDAGLTSQPKSAEMLAGNILRLLGDEKLRDILSLRARTLAEHELDWATIYEKLGSIYMDTLNLSEVVPVGSTRT